MSRLAKKPIVLPSGVTVKVEVDTVTVEGKLGKLTQTYLPYYVSIEVVDGKVMVKPKEVFGAAAYTGLYWAIIRNMVKGVSEGFSKQLTIQGLGYKWELRGTKLVCTVGFSHPVEFTPPQGITLALENNNTVLKVSGIDKHLVGQVAANIREIKPPEPYKGKGIRYVNEHVRIKEGKTGK
ncbi:50S ribosomal protein L6 [Thermospira aquatica]|uniref:Large ribosomal subunit protein uL6 n=1 Tax=Thermospira aquatica TaxID=2828656 RepID=A0AAX3B9W6_9SPIR|nr:50S ribosomal protein L6 [Thermospira aquatica]URA09053.1 50S ribosomal protein L6 [Thermospira aquatica]